MKKTNKILSVFLALAMLLSLCNFVVFADENVATVGGVGYSTLKAAIDAANAQENATVVLERDYDFEANEPGYGWTTAYVAAGEDTPRDNMIELSGTGLTLDLGGHTLSNLYNNTFKVTGENVTVENGTMTIGTLYAGSYSSKKGVTLYETPRLCSYVILTEGATNFTINNLSTTGGINISDGTTATVNGLTFTGASYYAICSQADSDVTINGGTFDKATAGYANYLVWVDNEAGQTSTMTINGGTFLKGTATFRTGANPVIRGGTFDFDPTSFGVAEGFAAVDNGDGTWTVKSTTVATVGGVKYSTLKAAIDAANAQENATVVLACDYDFEANEPGYGWTTAYVAAGEDTPRDNMIEISGTGLTLDLGGHTLSNLYNNTFKVTGENVTVENGTMTIGTLYAGSYSKGKITLYATPRLCSYVILTEGAANFTINNLSTTGGINISDGTTATVNGLTFTGASYYAICSQADSDVTINGGTFDKATAGYANYLIWVDNEAGQTSTMTINGGTFLKGTATFRTGANPVICGGTFDFDPTGFGVAEGFAAVDNGDGTWTVESTAVATVGGVGYATLKAAIDAANAQENATVVLTGDYDMEGNEPGYGWTTAYVAAGEDTPRDNMIELSGTGLTLDLGGHTLSNLYNNTFKVTGENVTVENGTMTIGTLYAGSYSSKKGVTLYGTPRLCSYVILTEGAANFTINNLSTTGGINISDGTTATVNGLTFTGASYYAICSQADSDVTINGGTFDKATAGYANYLVWVDAEAGQTSTMTINGGTFLKGTAQFLDTEDGAPTIYGGTFDFDPSDYVAEGFEAVDNGAGRWIVGEVKAHDLAPAAEATEGYEATYTASKQIIDNNDNENVLSAGETISINVKTSEEESVAVDTSLEKVKIAEIVSDVISKADIGDASVVNVEIKIVSSDADVKVEEEKTVITYEIHPEALVFVNDSIVDAVKIDNASLKDDVTFTINIPVPDALVSTGFVQVVHKSEGFADEVSHLEVLGTAGAYYVTTTISHFSEFELQIYDPSAVGTAVWGASLVLEDDIAINVSVSTLKNSTGTTESEPGRFKLKYTFGGVTKTYTMTNASLNKITVARVVPASLGDVVELELYYDETLIGSATYSAKQYCDDKIEENNDEKLTELCYALLEYGAIAQERFDYNATNLANADHPRDHAPYESVPSDYSYTPGDDIYDVVAQLGTSLSLESKTVVNFYFAPREGYAVGEYTATVNDTPVTIVNKGSYGLIKITGVAAKNLADLVEVELSLDSTASCTVTFSPLRYAYAMQESGTETNICRALYCYYLAAADYFA